MTTGHQMEDITRRIELERWDAAHKIMREAIKRIEGLSGNEMYERAWQRAIERLQDLDGELDRPGTAIRSDIRLIIDKPELVPDVAGTT